jgi:hypothetical protein
MLRSAALTQAAGINLTDLPCRSAPTLACLMRLTMLSQDPSSCPYRSYFVHCHNWKPT